MQYYKPLSQIKHTCHVTPPQLAVMAAQLREANASEEEVIFNTFVKASVSESLYKSKIPCFISKELSLKL